MNGRALALGTVAALAVTGMFAQRRGSRELTALTAVPGLSPTRSWKGIVGAAKGGPLLEAWKASLARFPFDLSIEVVGSLKAQDAWMEEVKRPESGTFRMCMWARETESPSGAAPFSPFMVAHRLFDVSASRRSPKLALSWALAQIEEDDDEKPVIDAEAVEVAKNALRMWARDDARSALKDEKGYAAAVDACTKSYFAQWASILKTYKSAKTLMRSWPHLIRNHDKESDLRPLLEEPNEEWDSCLSRILASLSCPTATGRLLRLTDYGQAMADCYATWVVSGRDPLVKLTERDLRNFSVDAQIERWLATASAKKATEVQIAKYRRELEQVAVPALQWIAQNDPPLFREAAKYNAGLRAKRAGLIKAANGVFALQRIAIL